LGSRRNQATRKARLAQHFDLTETALSRLHGPVGLQLGAKTPSEIAVAIVAEIVQVKNTVTQSNGEAVSLSSLDIGDSRVTACAL
jgi:xanthine dehydrogenase accessory factor